MKSRFLVPVAVLAAALAAPAAAQEKTGPAITAQGAPFGRILGDAKAVAKLVAGPAADEAIKAFDEKLKEALGEKGFTGADLTRPPAGYVEIRDPAEKSYAVVLIPVTGEEEFLGLLDRMKLDAEPVKGAKGLYELSPKDEAKNPDVPIRLRFKDGYAYVGINAPDAALAADKLVPAGDLIVPTETALFAYRGYMAQYPETLKKQLFEAIDKAAQEDNNLPLPDAAKTAVKDIAGLYKRLAEQSLKEGDVASYRIDLDPRTGEVVVESGLTARPGTPLAKDIAARKPTTNRFAGLIGDEAAAGFLVQLPFFAAELRDATAAGLKEANKLANDQIPEEYKAVADEAIAGLARTVKTGEFDVAGALTGPDANGFYGAAAAVSFEDTAALEKVLRKLHAGAPEEIQNMIKLDAAKVGEVAVHRVPVGLFLPAEAKKVFGDKASVSLAFAPKGIYVTFGPDSLGAMKTALGKEPAPAKVLDIQVNPARFGKLLEATNGDRQAKELAQMLGTEDKLYSLYGLAIEGGKELKLRFTVNLIPFGRGMAAGFGVAQPVPAELR